jgi:hypothetical protein
MMSKMVLEKVEIPVIFEVELFHPEESTLRLTYVSGTDFGEDEYCKERAMAIQKECQEKYSYYHDIRITTRHIYNNMVYDNTILYCGLFEKVGS